MAVYVYVGVAWVVAQLCKLFAETLRHGVFRWRYLVTAGGMPSGHCSVVSALSLAVALDEGVASGLFAVTLAFTLIVMYDAYGHHNIKRHSGLEVFLGTLIGILTVTIASLLY